MIALAITGAYLVGWVIAASVGMWTCANRFDACRPYSFTSRSCDHLMWGHWKGDGSIGYRETMVGCISALAWPILWLPALAFLLATRKPTPRGLSTRIAELEREAGIR